TILKKFSISICLIFLLIIIGNANLFSQVQVMPYTAAYSSLYNAFTAINLGYHGYGAITVTIYSNTFETSAAVLNGGMFTSCLIKPSGARTVSGSFNDALIVF